MKAYGGVVVLLYAFLYLEQGRITSASRPVRVIPGKDSVPAGPYTRSGRYGDEGSHCPYQDSNPSSSPGVGNLFMLEGRINLAVIK
jgi:hypothetical protein